jgi:hypothetical protein
MTTPVDPRAEFQAFPRNSRFYAEYWLMTGTRHPGEHWVIAAKLDDWVSRVDPALQEELLDDLEGVG